MKGTIKTLLTLLLCLSLLAPAAAFAEGETAALPDAPAPAAQADASAARTFLDPDEMQALLDAYIAEHHLNPEKLSVGYVYTDTGESWYYNPDVWFYGASTYKVPLMMILAEREYRGELTRDSKVGGLELGYAEDIILTHSHNDYAHLMMRTIGNGSEPDCVELFKQYADLPADYYIPDFREYRYFTARYLTSVMTTLFREPERFPNIIECLLPAQPGEYFRHYLDQYPIAQKYGSLEERNGDKDNHTTGIIYMPHPIILTVMTVNAPSPEQTIGEIARLFAEYTLQVDARYEQYQHEAELEAARLAAEEEARRLQEEAAAQERATAAAEETAEPVPDAATEPQDAAPRESAPQDAPTPTAGRDVRTMRLIVIAGAFGVLLLAAVILALRRRH